MLLDSDPIPLLMVSYHRPRDLRRCLTSVLATEQAFVLHIIDNSGGGLDAELATINDSRVVIHKNAHNKGKGRAFMECYAALNTSAPWLVSIDADIEVQPNWLLQLQLMARRLAAMRPVALLAPLILRDDADSLDRQLRRGWVMHKASETTQEILPGTFYNRHTAGPLLLINKAFFDKCGGYPMTQLYGNEDGRLCAEAAKRGLFTGFTTTVQVRHLNTDNEIGYIKWKRRNVRGVQDGRGYWD